jgi:undecaprenyl-diphosphatase
MSTIDHRLQRWVVLHRVGWLNTPVVDLTRVATDGLLFVVIAAVLAVVWRRPWVFAAVVAADVIADLTSLGLRQLIGRPRPFLAHADPSPLVNKPSTGSFPSGHTATAFACATVIAWAWPKAAVPVFVLAALVGWSRVYVGVHYPLDVLGGALLGTLVGALVAFLTRRGGLDAGGDSARSTAPESSGPPTA